MAESPQQTGDGHERRRGSRLNSDDALSGFLLRAAHDLRSPLRAIRTHAELLIKNSATAQAGAFEPHLRFIVDGARRIELLADGLSNYSIALRIEENSFRSVPAGLLLRTALAKLGKELSEHGAEVIYNDLPRVHGDPDRLSQVFENLLTNAVRHRGSAAPRIHIVAEQESAYWRFAVRDNGPGVEAAYLERIFQPFERLHPEGSAAPGLGLAISREIVERHGGRMWAESEIGAGATFLFTLPADG